MWYVIAIVIAAAGLILGLISYSSGNVTGLGDSDSLRNSVPYDSIKKPLSRQALKQKLENLANKPVPAKLESGAMCYKMASPPNRVEYICPVCHEKTLYSDESGYFLNANLESCRSLAAKLTAINCHLDETQFCKKCSPEIVGLPELCIETQYAEEGQKNRVCGITHDDLEILRDFLDGKVVYKDDYDNENPLKEKLSRISTLLGIELDKK